MQKENKLNNYENSQIKKVRTNIREVRKNIKKKNRNRRIEVILKKNNIRVNEKKIIIRKFKK